MRDADSSSHPGPSRPWAATHVEIEVRIFCGRVRRLDRELRRGTPLDPIAIDAVADDIARICRDLEAADAFEGSLDDLQRCREATRAIRACAETVAAMIFEIALASEVSQGPWA